jgi:ribosomal protein S18 acetylase RimI-like enzyme
MSNGRRSRVRIRPVTQDDLPAIRAAYETARILQLRTGSKVWPTFADDAILLEIAEQKVFGVFKGGVLAGVFTLLEADPVIWGELERGEHLYIHRMAGAAGCTLPGLFDTIVRWARQACQALGLAGIRMDTWASNGALIDYYSRHGFEVVGRRTMPPESSLPPHYHGLELVLLEKSVARPPQPTSARSIGIQSAAAVGD